MLALKKKYHYFNVPKHLIFSFQFYIFKFQNFHISIQINIFSILLRSFHNKSSLIVKQLKNKLLNSIQFYLQSITKSRKFSVSVFFCFSQFFFFFYIDTANTIFRKLEHETTGRTRIVNHGRINICTNHTIIMINKSQSW